jgi:hypothetical protein
MLPSMSAFKPLGIVIALAGGCATAVIAPSPVHAITGGEDAGPGERPDVEIITFNTLFDMSEPGLKIVRNNPRAYRFQDSLLPQRHLRTLVNALIYAPNKTRRLMEKLDRIKSGLRKSWILEDSLIANTEKAGRLHRQVFNRGSELRAKGYRVNYRTHRAFGQKSSDPEVQDLYRLHDQLTALEAYNAFLQALNDQVDIDD